MREFGLLSMLVKLDVCGVKRLSVPYYMHMLFGGSGQLNTIPRYTMEVASFSPHKEYVQFVPKREGDERVREQLFMGKVGNTP